MLLSFMKFEKNSEFFIMTDIYLYQRYHNLLQFILTRIVYYYMIKIILAKIDWSKLF